MLASVSMVLAWTGYDLPLPRNKADTPPDNFVYSLWVATGQTKQHGTTTAGTQKALKALLPEAPIFFGAGSPDEVIQLLENNAAIRVTVKCRKLNPHLKRWVGSYNGGHAIAIIGTRMNGTVREVFWMDPFGKPFKKDGSVRYAGEWIPWSDVSGVLDRNADGIIVAFGYKSAAVPVVLPPVDNGGTGSTDMILTNVVELSRGTVAASTPVLHPQTLAPLFNIGPGECKLVGESADGKYFGVLVNSKKIAGKNPKVALVEKVKVTDVKVWDPKADLEAQLSAAIAESAALQTKLDADKADAQSIVER